MEIGAAIKERRQARHLSLGDLAARSGVSRAMLSEIERGLKNPTVRIAMQIAVALETTVAALLGEATASPATGPAILQRADRPTVVEPTTQVVRQELAPAYATQGVVMYWYTVPAHQQTVVPTLLGPDTIIQLVVFWGRLTCLLPDRQLTLEEGDSALFTTTLPQALQNLDPAPCEFLLISDHRGPLSRNVGVG